MDLVETKTYAFKMSRAERERLRDIAEELRSIERQIDDVIGNDYPIEVGGCDAYTGEDLWRAAELLDAIVCGSYQI